MLISWKKELEIGNEMIDTQHRMLVLLLKKLNISIKRNMDRKIVMGILLEIKKFTEFHFLRAATVARRPSGARQSRHSPPQY